MNAQISKRIPARHLALAILLALALPACGNVKSVRFTSETPDAVLAQLQQRKGLSVEETRLLYSYLARTQIDLIEGRGPSLVGRTVGEVIAEERAWEQGHKEVIAESQRHAASWRERGDQARQAMTDVLTLRVWEATDVEQQPQGSPRQLRLRIGLSNKSDRAITAFEGAVRFTDVYGRELFECPIHVAERLPAGEDAERLVFADCVPSPGREGGVRHVRLADAKMTWEPYVVRLDDGTELTMPQE